jgi:hypothetical protein
MDAQAIGVMVIHTTDKTTAHKIQHGIENHFLLLSNVVFDGVNKYQVRVVTKMRKKDALLASAYALGVIDGVLCV